MALLIHRRRFHCWLITLVLSCLLSACSSPFFYPDQWIRLTPDKLGLDYRDVVLEAQDGTRLHAWHLLPATQPKGIILVLHGNAENISTHIHSVAWLAESGYELLLLDYRGFGESHGSASLPAVFEDIDAAAHWLEQRAQSVGIPIYWLGQSIGASLSSYYLSEHPVEGLKAVILDTPFASYRRMGREKFSEFWLTWPFQYPLSWLIDDRFSPERTADNWPQLPLLVFSSRDDGIVPAHHTRALLERLPHDSGVPVEFVETNGSHIGTYQNPAHRQLTLDFLARFP